MSARNRELLALIPASLLVTGGFTAVFIERHNVLSNGSLTYGLVFLGLCLAAHVLLRFTLPDADPYLFPLFAVLACVGLVMIYRIDETLARQQAQWFVIGLGLFAGTIVLLRDDYRVLERYRYTIAAAGLVLLLLPRVPGIGSQVNGAYLGVRLGSLTFQPAEFAKIAIIIFLASYLRDTRQLLVIGARRFAGITFPPLKYLGPLLVVWGAAMAMLFLIQDIGSSLMFFGGFLALLYVATNRLSFVTIGLGMFAAGSWALYQMRPTIQNRVDAWLHPFNTPLYDRVGGSYQLAQSLFAQADGGIFGQGFGQGLIQVSGQGGHMVQLLPAAQTDLIYAVITNELGLVGAVGVICTYLLAVERGFKIATLAKDSFSKLLATGLTAVFALQVFVIVGGVTKVIPLTGVTLPFISYGGSSILANFVLLALLLLVSDRARREVRS
ncbi:MAG: cell cycle protein [Solirubrobacterales bacterium]|nr:cell cycle protein [Solirubrobacterales bacterium]